MSQSPVRLALRLESGERRGEVVPIPEAGLTVGRRPENDLVLADPSVSGRHALLRIDKDRLWVEDLGSTNGTKLGGRSVGRTELASGDLLAFGAIECSVVEGGASAMPDRPRSAATPAPVASPVPTPSTVQLDPDELSLEDPDPPQRASAPTARSMPARAVRRAAAPAVEAPALVADEPAPAGPVAELERLSAADLERARARGVSLPVLALLFALVAGGAAAWWFFGRERGEASAAVVAVRSIEGNLLRGASFEPGEGADAWSELEGAPATLERDTSFAASGAAGLGIEGALAGEWAAVQSAAVAVRAGQSLEIGATVRASGAHVARLAVSFESAADETLSAEVLGPLVKERDSADEVRAIVPVPEGHDRARLVLLAGARAGDLGADGAAAGGAALDDAVLRPASATPELVATVGDWRVLRVAADELLLLRFDRLVARVRVAAGTDALARSAELATEALELDRGVRIAVVGAPVDARIVLELAEQLFRGGVSTLAADGLRGHATRFEREGARAVLAGEGLHQVRFGFEQPKDVVAEAAAGWMTVLAGPFAGEAGFELQLSFQQERIEAQRLAEAARGAASVGDALAAWNQLLERYPFEAELVREGESARARAVEEGLAGLRELEADAARARFFGLAELLERAASDARSLAGRYAGSEVEERARALADALAVEVAELAGDPHAARRSALEAMRAHFAREEAAVLASRVGSTLEALAAD